MKCSLFWAHPGGLPGVGGTYKVERSLSNAVFNIKCLLYWSFQLGSLLYWDFHWEVSLAFPCKFGKCFSWRGMPIPLISKDMDIANLICQILGADTTLARAQISHLPGGHTAQPWW